MASSCDRVVPLIADQMRPGTERAQMGVLGAVAEKQKKRHASHALLISWLGDSCAANKSVHASLRSLAWPRREVRLLSSPAGRQRGRGSCSSHPSELEDFLFSA